MIFIKAIRISKIGNQFSVCHLCQAIQPSHASNSKEPTRILYCLNYYLDNVIELLVPVCLMHSYVIRYLILGTSVHFHDLRLTTLDLLVKIKQQKEHIGPAKSVSLQSVRHSVVLLSHFRNIFKPTNWVLESSNVIKLMDLESIMLQNLIAYTEGQINRIIL